MSIGNPSMKSVCIEGWRGINHSIAMVNQHQLLALLDQPGLQVWHRDLPYYLPHWTRQQMTAGFSAQEQARIDAVPEPPVATHPDCLLRVSSPFHTVVDPAQRTLTFMVTEVGLEPGCFMAPIGDLAALTCDGNRVVTPTNWSRDRLVDYGLPHDRVLVVPHGFKADVFQPLPPEQRRQARQALGVADDEILFLNVGVATWNKGLDLLITAYAQLRRRYPRVRLLLKDHKSMYGVGVERTLADVAKKHPGLVDEAMLASVSVVSTSLDQGQMRALYAVADAYVSPYRAEGFNLPALEAMACGTPVIVTEGGATEDFCPPMLARRLAATPLQLNQAPIFNGRYLEPDPTDLLAALVEVVDGQVPRDDPRRVAEREQLARSHHWQAVVAQLATHF